MKNCIILGSARSGTSMVAGILSKSGYFMGDNLIGPNELNQKGNLESVDINELNNKIIHSHLTDGKIPKDLPMYATWLYEIPLELRITPPTLFDNEIAGFTEQEPFCYKDPRFSYTLSAWEPYMQETVRIGVFREPDKSIDSLIRASKYYHDVEISKERASNVWAQMYSHILDLLSCNGEWLFLHYNQIISGDGIERLREITDANIDKNFPDSSLSKSISIGATPKKCKIIYQKLCALAEFKI